MKNNQKGFGFAEILLVIVVVGLIGTVVWLVYNRQNPTVVNENMANSTTPSANNPEKPTAKRFDCADYSVEQPDGWYAWTQSLQNGEQNSGVQCFVSTWTEANIPPQITKSYEDVAVVINFSLASNYSPRLGSIKEIMTDYYSDSETWEYKTTLKSIEDFQFNIGNGVKVITEGGHSGGEHTTYYYLDGTQVINLVQTQTTNASFSETANNVIKSLQKN